MSESKIKTIVCAVYGKPSSRATATRAIDLALEHNAKLIFLHAINAEFLKSSTPAMMPLEKVYKQLHELGQFAMLILIDRAQRRGVTHTEYQVRAGNVREQFLLALLEIQPEMLVIGTPTTSLGESAFKGQTLEQFTQQLHDKLNILIEIVEPDTD